MRPVSLILFGLIGCRSEKAITTVNAAPTAIITSHQDGDAVDEGYPIEVRAQVSDSNHPADTLEVSWYYGETEICPWAAPDAGGGTFCDILPNLDEDTVRVEVRDPDGSGAFSAVLLNIVETAPPTASIDTPVSSGVYYTDQKVTFAGSVNDAEDDADELTIEWSSDIDGLLTSALEVTTSGEVTTADYLSEGEHLITLTVTDTTSKSDIASTTIVVGPPNTAPTCGIVSPNTGDTIIDGELVIFEATVADVDIPAVDLSVEWHSDKDGLLGTSSSNSNGEVQFAYGDLSVNTHTISLEVTDELGASCVDSIILTTGTPPSVTIQNPVNGDVFTEGEAVIFSVLVEDEQDQPDDVSLTWTLDGQPYTTIAATSSGTAEFTENGLAAGAHTLAILAEDTDGLTDAAQVSFTINGIPSQPVIEILPTAPYTSDDLSVNILTPSVDPEGLTVSYTYQWYKNGILENGATNSSLSAGLTTKNEIWSVQVTPTDGLAQGNAGSDSTTILNAPPTISGTSITSNATPITNDSILSCQTTVVDPDDTVTPTFSWNINGQSASGASINLSNYAVSGGDTVSCTASANDGFAATVTETVSVSITNRAPTVSNVSISPSTLYSNSTASCIYTTQDPDGDTLTTQVAWFAGSQSIGTGATLPLTGLVSRNDPVYCSVDTSDGQTNTSLSSAVTFIQNTAPTAPSISTSSANTTGAPGAEIDDVYCTVNTPSTDIDGDSLTYTYTWTGPNGQSVVHAGQTSLVDTLPATTPTTEGLWICSVHADDGLLSSTTATSTIVVESGCPAEGNGSDSTCPSSDCHSILQDGHAQLGDDGIYWIDPTGNAPYQAYCDMSTNGGGWTMCYTENANMIHLQTETTFTGTYGQAGYRSNCNEVAFTDVLYVNHDNGQKAWFTAQSGTAMTIANLGFVGNGANAGTLFTGGGVAPTNWNYQLMVCDTSWMWTGLMISGYTGCYKQCGNWCSDTSSPYFRTDGDDGGTYNGVAFNQNGHTNVSYKTMSVGIR